MGKLCETIPIGAITTIDELRRFLAPFLKKEQDVTGYVVICTGFPTLDGQPALLVSKFKVGQTSLDRNNEKLRGVGFPDLDLQKGVEATMDLDCFCIDHSSIGNYIFSNYWHAYAFKRRVEHAHRNQHG